MMQNALDLDDLVVVTPPQPTAADDDWFTPQRLLDLLPAIGLDPCWSPHSHVVARRVVDAAKGENGLQVDWDVEQGEIVFANPPYSDCAAWVERCCFASWMFDSVVVALIPAKPGERYWHRSIWGSASAVGFLDGRIAFDTIRGVGKSTGNFGSAFVVWGPLYAARAARDHIASAAKAANVSIVWVDERAG